MIVMGRRLARSDAILLVAVVAVVVSVGLAAASAGRASLDDRARAIEAQLRCPTCQGLSIADSPATSAAQMRALVSEQLAAGASGDEVRAFFVARYGRWILLDPPVGGPDLALWLAPAVFVATGAALVVRRSRTRGHAGTPRRWSARSPLPASRLSTIVLGAAMALALAVPIAAAVGPRLAGRELSGGPVPPSATSIEDLEAFVGAEPDDVEALIALADALLEGNRAGEAAERYTAALELDPSNVRALLGVGTILLGADRPDAAGPVFDRVLALYPDQPDALLYRAMARLRLDGNATDDVRRDVERFLEVAPTGDPRRTMAAELLDAAPATPQPTSSSPPSGSPAP